MKTKTTKIRNTANTVFIPVLATIFVPISRLDASQEADKGKTFAAEILRDSEITIGGVDVKAVCHAAAPRITSKKSGSAVAQFGCVSTKNNAIKSHIERELTLVGINPQSLHGRIAIQALAMVAELDGQTSAPWLDLAVKRLGRIHSRSH